MATTNRFLYLMDIFLSVLKCDQSNFFHSPLVLSINTIQYYYSTKGQENKGLTDLKNPLVSQSHTKGFQAYITNLSSIYVEIGRWF